MFICRVVGVGRGMEALGSEALPTETTSSLKLEVRTVLSPGFQGFFLYKALGNWGFCFAMHRHHFYQWVAYLSVVIYGYKWLYRFLPFFFPSSPLLRDRVFLCDSPGCPRACSVEQAGVMAAGG